MIFSTILISLFASAVLCSDVIELSDSDFTDRVKDEEIMLVEFFAPWYVCTISYFRLAQLVHSLTLSQLARRFTQLVFKLLCFQTGADTARD